MKTRAPGGESAEEVAAEAVAWECAEARSPPLLHPTLPPPKARARGEEAAEGAVAELVVQAVMKAGEEVEAAEVEVVVVALRSCIVA